MATSSSTQFTNVFGSAPRPVRELDELYARARAASHATLSRTVLDLLNIRVDLPVQDKERFPRAGAVVVVANHPFGLLDGLVLDAVLQELRPDVKILANSLLWGIEELGDRCLPVVVFGGCTNLRPVRQALRMLRDGHGIAIFPAGEVAHWRAEQRSITDSPCNNTAAQRDGAACERFFGISRYAVSVIPR